MTKEEVYRRLQPCGFKYIGAFDYKHIINECPRINRNLASTKNAMYCYTNTEGWLRINSVSPLIFDVKDSGYVKERGYYVVIDNSENFQIDTNSVIEYWLNGEIVTEEIVGIEKRTLLLDPPHPASDWGLITRNKITPDGGLKEIMIKLYEQQIEEEFNFKRMTEKGIKKLTWEDIELIVNIDKDTDNEESIIGVRSNKEHYREVLKRFREIKDKGEIIYG